MTELSFDELVKLVNERNLKTINVCGSPGSGKSTLSIKLSQILGYKLIDLDDYLYNENCKRKSKDEDILELKQVLTEQNIIIDGTYSSTLEYRIDKVDLFIFTKRNILLSLYRFTKRLLTAKNLKCGERLTWKTLTLIINYKKVENDIFTKLIPIENMVIYKGI
jgi:adenylate kinase family enzyme